MNRTRNIILTQAALGVALLTLSGCPSTGLPGGIPGRGASKVDPNTCGNYAASDAGRKLKAFLEATVQLEAAVKDTENYVRDTCAIMGKELGMAPGDLQGDTRAVCDPVITAIRDNLKVGLKAEAKVRVDYKPAVCRVNVDIAAKAAAQCQAKAQADISVRCQGSCTGTCAGRCDGSCEATNAQGECEGACDGVCQGSCTGGCDGHAEVEAEASCKAHAEVRANVDAECTKPEVKVEYDADVVVDASKVEAVKRAIEAGLPRILFVKAKVEGPLRQAFTTWSKASAELAAAGRDLVSSLGDQALCVAGQISAAANMLASIKVSFEVQVEVSASVSGSVGG